VITCTDITEQKKVEQSLRVANEQLERRAEEIERDLNLASRVQQSLAPHALLWGRVAVETHYMPVRTIGGDFGMVVPHDPGHLDLIVCDVSGHGISSALLANRIYTETVSLLRQGTEPGELVRTLNRFVIEQIGHDSGFMFTMAAARVDQRGRQLTYAAAGHPPGLLIYSPTRLHQIEPRSTVLGALENAVAEEASEKFTLAAGDRLMLYSDGLESRQRNAWRGGLGENCPKRCGPATARHAPGYPGRRQLVQRRTRSRRRYASSCGSPVAPAEGWRRKTSCSKTILARLAHQLSSRAGRRG
jgi:sigma-B regulation protein RsbU (phosphoserine phosphatase)